MSMSVLDYYIGIAESAGYEKLCEKYNPVTAYAHMVTETEYAQLCGKDEILACKRHLADMERSATDPEYPFVFDMTRVDRIIRHFANLMRTDVPNETIKLEDWQIFDYGSIFGWVRRDDGRRRFKTAFIENPRGHAKTTVASAIGLYFMLGDALYPPFRPDLATYELQPEINVVAIDREQGKIARDDMAIMAQNSPVISSRLSVRQSYIRNKKRGGQVRVFSKDTKNKDGGRPSLVITEEYHAHTDDLNRSAAIQGKGKRSQSLELIITTAGEDAEEKPCYRDHLQYEMLLRGEISQEDVFVMIRRTDDDDDPHDKKTWCKANAFFRRGSAYGSHLFEEVESQYADAYAQNNYSKIRKWLIKRMDRWQTLGENKYMNGCMDKFKDLTVPREEFRELTRGVAGYYGFDLGEKRDLTGVGYCAELPDGRIAVSVMGFIAQNRAEEHRRTDRVPYDEWAREGYVILTPGDVVDSAYVEDYIYTCESDDPEIAYANGRGSIEIDYDGYNATEMAIRMREHYNDESKIVEIMQNCASLNGATKGFREMILLGKIVAEYSPLMIWCLGNAVEVKNSNGDIKLSKRTKDDSQRIDPIAALMNALSRLITKVDIEAEDINEIIDERGYFFG